MRVAVVCASQYGATMGIAERIGAELAVAGFEVRVFDAARPPHAEATADFDAFVVGSAVYMGHWLREATMFVRRYQPTLLEHPVWLFSSGPLVPSGAGQGPGELREDPASLVPAEIADFTRTVRPIEHRVFAGAIDPEALSLPHRMIRRFPGGTEKIPAGDYRDWPEIEAWARDIARRLLTTRRTRPGQPIAPSHPR